MSSTNWNAAKASTWMRRFADDLGHDAYKDQDPELWACCGAAYYSVIHGIGYNTRAEFIDFCRAHLGIGEWLIEEALEEIEGDSNI